MYTRSHKTRKKAKRLTGQPIRAAAPITAFATKTSVLGKGHLLQRADKPRVMIKCVLDTAVKPPAQTTTLESQISSIAGVMDRTVSTFLQMMFSDQGDNDKQLITDNGGYKDARLTAANELAKINWSQGSVSPTDLESAKKTLLRPENLRQLSGFAKKLINEKYAFGPNLNRAIIKMAATPQVLKNLEDNLHSISTKTYDKGQALTAYFTDHYLGTFGPMASSPAPYIDSSSADDVYLYNLAGAGEGGELADFIVEGSTKVAGPNKKNVNLYLQCEPEVVDVYLKRLKDLQATRISESW